MIAVLISMDDPDGNITLAKGQARPKAPDGRVRLRSLQKAFAVPCSRA